MRRNVQGLLERSTRGNNSIRQGRREPERMGETGKGAFRNGGRKTYIGLQKKKYFKYGPETVLCVRKCGAAGGGSAEEKTGDTQEKGSAACAPPGGEKQEPGAEDTSVVSGRAGGGRHLGAVTLCDHTDAEVRRG